MQLEVLFRPSSSYLVNTVRSYLTIFRSLTGRKGNRDMIPFHELHSSDFSFRRDNPVANIKRNTFHAPITSLSGCQLEPWAFSVQCFLSCDLILQVCQNTSLIASAVPCESFTGFHFTVTGTVASGFLIVFPCEFPLKESLLCWCDFVWHVLMVGFEPTEQTKDAALIILLLV